MEKGKKWRREWKRNGTEVGSDKVKIREIKGEVKREMEWKVG